jgi:hypothetical protein
LRLIRHLDNGLYRDVDGCDDRDLLRLLDIYPLSREAVEEGPFVNQRRNGGAVCFVL